MTRALDDMLEPGERVVWRSRRRWLPRDWPLVLVFAPLCGFLLALAHLGPLAIAVWSGLVLLGLGLWRMHGRLARSTLITERRVLHRIGWLRPALTAVPLDEVAMVSLTGRGTARVERRPFGSFEVAGAFEAQDFAAALADAAKLPRPAASGPLADLSTYGGLFALSLGFGVFNVLFAPDGMLNGESLGISDGMFVAAVLVLCPPMLLAAVTAVAPLEHLAYWLALAVLRPRLGRRAAHAWLRRTLRRRWSSRRARRREPPYHAAARWINRLLEGVERRMLRRTVGVVRRLYGDARQEGAETYGA